MYNRSGVVFISISDENKLMMLLAKVDEPQAFKLLLFSRLSFFTFTLVMVPARDITETRRK